MKLTLEVPQLVATLKDMPHGLLPVKIDARFVLIVKASKEVILTANLNNDFRIYVAPIEQNGQKTIGLLTAFFDEKINPRTLTTPLADDDFSDVILPLLCSPKFEVYFFDEHDQEHGSYLANNPKFKQFQSVISKVRILKVSLEESLEMISKIDLWFSGTQKRDDARAFPIFFEEKLFPNDSYFMDMADPVSKVTGAKPVSYSSLIRKNPGNMQEVDIVRLLLRIFPSDQIFLNLFTQSKKRELVDVLVVGKRHALFIEAKDSPNTEEILRLDLAKKKSKSLKQLEEANRQLKSGIKFAKRFPEMPVLVGGSNGENRTVSLQGLQLVGLAVIKELFEDNETFDQYSALTLKLIRDLQTPCVFLDYPDLNLYTRHTTDEESFMGALQQLYSIGCSNQRFGRLRFGLPPGIKEQVEAARRLDSTGRYAPEPGTSETDSTQE